jgi:enterochelin esterase-like enzyme
MSMRLRLHDVGGGSRARLLVVLDGPEYQRRMRLLTLLGRLAERGAVRPHRVALVVPEDRLETYSASASERAKRADELSSLPGRRVGIGASLGALALLHVHRTHADALSGLFLQSGSYFRRRTDRQEAGFARFGRVDRFVGTVLRGAHGVEPVPTTLTCALDDENYVNNAAVARALAEQGYAVDFHAARGGHDWPTWRRALELHLPPLLRRAWR